MSKAIKISPTNELYQAIEAYAQDHDLTLARASAELIAKGLGLDIEASQQHGDPRRIIRIAKELKTWECLWCGNVFFAKVVWECPVCGEDEVKQIVNDK
jgi:rubrerythrin